jgi:hypothetical protein
MGKLEGNRRDLSGARFFAARFSFRPRKNLEIGLSRSAQWCGSGRPCGFGAFKDLLFGKSNTDNLAADVGNQLAGYDIRWSSPWKKLPIAVYGQMIGEDEAGGLPSKFMGLFGVEIWGVLGQGSYRAHFEYADTACEFTRRRPQFDCGYESGIYTDGYRYRGRSIGHSMDGDGRMMALGFMWIDKRGDRWEALIRSAKLNRNATLVAEPNHTTALLARKIENLELSHSRSTRIGDFSLGLGVDRASTTPNEPSSTKLRLFLGWSQRF